MRVIETKAYTYEELSEKAKEKALDACRETNVNDYWEWRDSIYDDAETIGLKITGFELDRNRHATGEFIDSATEVAFKILKEHGETCSTYRTAKDFLAQWNELVKKYSDGVAIDKVTYENEYEFDKEANELEEEFLKDLLEDYSIMLQNEYEYLSSDEAVEETIIANEYEFTEDGERI